MHIGNSVTKGFKWTAVERFSVQGVQFLLSIIIARLITPTEYGVLGILMVFVNIAQVFIDSGLASAIIYHNDLRREELQTVFTFNLCVSVAIVALFFACAPAIERFYALPRLALYVRVSSLVLLANSFIVVPTAIFKVRMDFRSLAISNVVSTFLSGSFGVILAYLGYGVWALIWQVVSRATLQGLLLFAQVRWLPNLSFNMHAFRGLYKFGVNVFGTSVITKVAEEGLSLVIAKVMTPANLGIYTRSEQFANLPNSCLGMVVNTVMFPALSQFNKDKERFNSLYRKAIESQAALTMPLFILFFVVAEPLIRIVLTEKWIDVVPVLQILCIGRLFSIISIITQQVLMASGRSDLFLRQQIHKIIVKVVLVCVALPFGIVAVAIADAVSTIGAFFITNFCARNVSNYSIGAQLHDVSYYLLTSIITGLLSIVIVAVIPNDWCKIFFGALSFVVVYFISVTYVLHRRVLISLITSVLHR